MNKYIIATLLLFASFTKYTVLLSKGSTQEEAPVVQLGGVHADDSLEGKSETIDIHALLKQLQRQANKTDEKLLALSKRGHVAKPCVAADKDGVAAVASKKDAGLVIADFLKAKNAEGAIQVDSDGLSLALQGAGGAVRARAFEAHLKGLKKITDMLADLDGDDKSKKKKDDNKDKGFVKTAFSAVNDGLKDGLVFALRKGLGTAVGFVAGGLVVVYAGGGTWYLVKSSGLADHAFQFAVDSVKSFALFGCDKAFFNVGVCTGIRDWVVDTFGAAVNEAPEVVSAAAGAAVNATMNAAANATVTAVHFAADVCPSFCDDLYQIPWYLPIPDFMGWYHGCF